MKHNSNPNPSSARRGSRTYTVKMSIDGIIREDDIVIEKSVPYRRAQQGLNTAERNAKMRGLHPIRNRISLKYAAHEGASIIYIVEDKVEEQNDKDEGR